MSAATSKALAPLLLVLLAATAGPPRSHENLVGRRMPDIGLNGDQRGKVIVVDVWATWCRPCVDEMPRLEREIWQRHKGEVTVVGIARGESRKKVDEFASRNGITFPLLADEDRVLSRQFGGDDAIPRVYLADRTGTIVHQTIGYGPSSFPKFVAVVEKTIATPLPGRGPGS